MKLSDFIKAIEKITGKRTDIKILAKQAGDMENTWANVQRAKKILGWEPHVALNTGLQNYINWLHSNEESFRLLRFFCFP